MLDCVLQMGTKACDTLQSLQSAHQDTCEQLLLLCTHCTQHDEQELARAQTEASSARSLGRAEAHAEEPSTLEEADALLKEAVARIASGLHQPSYSEALCLAIAWRLEVKQALRRSADCIQARLQGASCHHCCWMLRRSCVNIVKILLQQS